MTWHKRFASRLQALFRKHSLEEELDEELRLHLAMQTEDYIEEGMSPEEARREARRNFGGLDQVKEEYRDRWSFVWLDTVWRDLCYAVRTLGKSRSFTMIAVLTLALGIGTTAAVFNLIQGVLLTPPPYEEPEQLVLVTSVCADGRQSFDNNWPAAQWMEWQAEAESFQGVAGYGWRFGYLFFPEGTEAFEGMTVTSDYFSVMGLEPVLGRTPLEWENDVILLGYEYWQRKFQGDPDALGQTIRTGDRLYTIIGVMPPGVRFLPDQSNSTEPGYDVNGLVEIWRQANLSPNRLKRAAWDVVARLKSGVTLEEAQAELALIAERQAQGDSKLVDRKPQVQSLTSEFNRDGERILLPLFGAAALVLLIACGSVAALLLVRGLGRQQEYAVRAALGVGRAGLFRQASTESLLLALAGGSLGAGIAFGVVHVFKLIGGHAIPRLDSVSTGWPVVVFGLGLALIATILAGLIPAWRASRLDPNEVLKGAGPKATAGRGERRLLRTVTMAQTALTLVLLVGAGLLIRTMINLANVSSGYDTRNILTMTVASLQETGEARREFQPRALERVSALPGVRHAAFVWGTPLTTEKVSESIIIEGQAPDRARDAVTMIARKVTPSYFELLGMKVSEGRDFRSTDNRDAPRVAIVNRAFADRYFPDTFAIGKRIWFEGERWKSRPKEIIGIVTDARTDDLTQQAVPELYFCFWQGGSFSKHLLVRTEAEPLSMASAVQKVLRELDPSAAVANIKAFDQIRADSLASRSFAMKVLVGFSVVACVLTLVGIYGVLSLSVASRRHEIAIRTAVGAEPRDIRKLIFSDGFGLIAGGVVAGLAGALVLSRVLRSFLFEVEPTDPATLIGVGLLFVGVALLACWAPTRRALEVHPLEALRDE